MNFWLFLDSLSSDQHKLIGERFNELNKCGHFSEYCDILCQYARRVLENEERLWLKVHRYCNFISSFRSREAATWATHELVGMHELIVADKEIHILPLFNCATS